MNDQLQPARTEPSGLSLKDLYYKYSRFLPLVVLSVALSLLVAYLILRYSTPLYVSTGALIIQDERNPRRGDEFEELFSSGSAKNIQSEIEYIRSRPLMDRVVKELNLNFSYYAVGKIKELNVYKASPIVVEALELVDSSATFTLKLDFANDNAFRVNGEGTPLLTYGQTFKNPYGVFRVMRHALGPVGSEYRVTWKPTSAVSGGFISHLLVAPRSQGTGILTLSLESDNPQLAADVINQLMIEYQEATVEDKNATTRQTLEFIDGRLRVISAELDSVTSHLLAYQRANNLIDLESQSSSYFTQLQETDKELSLQQLQLEMARSIEAYLSDKRNDFTTTPSTLGLTDNTLSTLISAYNVAQLSRKELVDANVPRTNPRVQQAEEQIEKLRQKILENLRVIRNNYGGSIADLRRKNLQVEGQIRSLPAKQQNLIEIKREQESKLAVYNLLQQKREESAISLAATISDTKVLDQAVANYNPVKPNRRNIQMIAIVVGLAIPALVIFVLEVTNDRVNSRADIERLTGATILGEVGHSFGKETLVVEANNRGIVSEQFRIIRSNLQYILNNIHKPVILVTSSFSGEGKSFISTNIGAVMALANKRTIVLEFDIRKPKILSQLGMPKKPGLINFLLGKAALPDLPIPVEGHENLFVLACGPVPPNPAELLLDAKMDDLFTYLRQQFDVVIIDTAPVGMVSDAMTLSKFANATLYIVRQGYTHKKQVGLIDEFYHQNKLPKVSLILNDVKIRTGYGYYGYGRYGYGADSYSSGYFDAEPEPPKGIFKYLAFMGPNKGNKKKKKK